MKKKIFLDLDETLIHAKYAGRVDSLQAAEPVTLHPTIGVLQTSIVCKFHNGFDDEHELYRAYLRPNAVEFIQSVQNEFGKENVYILTRAVTDYAEKFARAFNFGIEDEKIYAREIIPQCMEPQEGFHAVLVDNLPGRQCEDKTSFLKRSMFSKVSTIQVREFYGRKDNVLSDYLLEKIRSI